MTEECICKAEDIIFLPCSGGSNCGQIANQVAVKLTEEGVGNIYCLAGIGAHVDGMIESVKGAKRIVALDGCNVACAKKTIEHAGLSVTDWVCVTEEGINKDHQFKIADEEVDLIARRIKESLAEPAKSSRTRSKFKKVLFVCAHNSARSQMAEAFFNHLARGTAEAKSAGTQPAERLDDHVLEAMWELGIEIYEQRPKLLTPDLLAWADRVITMGYGVDEVYPATFVETEHWALEDPKGKSLEYIWKIRDEIKKKVIALNYEAK